MAQNSKDIVTNPRHSSRIESDSNLYSLYLLKVASSFDAAEREAKAGTLPCVMLVLQKSTRKDEWNDSLSHESESSILAFI